MVMSSCNVFSAKSPEFGDCRLEVFGEIGNRVMKLLSNDNIRLEYAIGEEYKDDIVDCQLCEDDDYYYLTSYLSLPVKTVRVIKRSIVPKYTISNIGGYR